MTKTAPYWEIVPWHVGGSAEAWRTWSEHASLIQLAWAKHYLRTGQPLALPAPPSLDETFHMLQRAGKYLNLSEDGQRLFVDWQPDESPDEYAALLDALALNREALLFGCNEIRAMGAAGFSADEYKRLIKLRGQWQEGGAQ